MGYYTKYNFTVYPAEATSAIEEALAGCSGYGNLSEEPIKWYDHENHCKQVTRQVPGVLLSLTGEGEDTGDLWRKDFLDGEIVDIWRFSEIPPPDVSLIVKVEQRWQKTKKERMEQQKRELEAKLRRVQHDLKALESEDG